MSTGLKKVWGLNDAKAAPSTAQADQFKASYQALLNTINTALQYTVINAEKPKHAEKVKKRDGLNANYQSTLCKIDPRDPSKAQSAIQSTLASAQSASQEICAFKGEVEQAVAAWQAKDPTFEKAISMVEELEAWGDKEAPPMHAQVKTIQGHVNNKRFIPAVSATDALMRILQPVYDNYLKQKAAKEKYDPALATLQPDLAKAAECRFKKLDSLQKEIATARGEMESYAKEKEYVTALEKENALEGKVKDYLAKLDELEKQKKACEDALAALQPKLDKISSGPQYKKLADQRSTIDSAKKEMEASAQSEEFEQATKQAGNVTTLTDDYAKLADEIEKQKKAYEDALAALQPQLQPTTQSQHEKLKPLEEEIAKLQTAMEKSAQDEEYEQALKQVGDLATKVEEYTKAVEELEKKKAEYETALAAAQPDITKATQSKAKAADLEPIQADIKKLQSDMEAKAKAEEYEESQKLLGELQPKVKEFLAAVEKKKQEYETAKKAIQPKLDDCMVQAHEYKELLADKNDLVNFQETMEVAATAEDFDTAKLIIDDLAKKCDAYLEKVKKAQQKYDQLGDQIKQQLDGADDATRGDVAKAIAKALDPDDVAHLPSEIRNRMLAEIQKGGLTDDAKKACKVLFSQPYMDPEFEKLDMQRRREMIENMKKDPAFKQARDNWDKLTQQERIDIMQKAVDYQAAAYGIPKTTIETYDKNDKHDYGYYNHDDGVLHVNANDAALKKGGFDEAIDTAVHENGHRQQATMVDNLSPPPDPPKIKPGDPEYNQAVTFQLNDTKRGYYVQPVPDGKKPTPNTGDEYFTQPLENHSRVTGRAVKNAQLGK